MRYKSVHEKAQKCVCRKSTFVAESVRRRAVRISPYVRVFCCDYLGDSLPNSTGAAALLETESWIGR